MGQEKEIMSYHTRCYCDTLYIQDLVYFLIATNKILQKLHNYFHYDFVEDFFVKGIIFKTVSFYYFLKKKNIY